MNGRIKHFLRICIVLCGLCHIVRAQQTSVSPKLDFDDEAVKTNDTVPIMPGTNKGRADEKQRDTDHSDERTHGQGSKSGPKIHGVRVTVDTGDNQKSKESKESVEITDLGKKRKRVGIHTDITFEITADGEVNVNKTSRENDDDKEDASVPIFKGRSSHKNRKPNDPKWNPNFSTERRGGYDNNQGRSHYQPDYPEYYPGNVPVYIGTVDTRGSAAAGSSIYRQSDGWNSYVPRSSYWTTERTHGDSYKPNDVSGYRQPSWKPCYCLQSGTDYRRRRDNYHNLNQPHQHVNVAKSTSPVIEIVDGKLERPFSKKKR